MYIATHMLQRKTLVHFELTSVRRQQVVNVILNEVTLDSQASIPSNLAKVEPRYSGPASMSLQFTATPTPAFSLCSASYSSGVTNVPNSLSM